MPAVSPVAEIVTAIVALLLTAIAVLAATKRIRLPFTVALVLVGIAITGTADLWPHLEEMLGRLELSPDLILYVFLPTLIFESSFNLDARRLRHNIGPVLTLAVPGLLISTGIIGLVVWAATPVPLAAALLLGAILSATDPVAVVALFRQLGAPQRLTVLVEGESLFNDATSIVLARILVGVVAAGTVSAADIGGGLIDFVVLFAGGIAAGGALGWLTGLLLGRVESDTSIEITLTTFVAYASFLLAEEVLHVSGVMATVAAGVTLGGWGRVRISADVRGYLEHFWEYMAFVANALIFLMVGMQVDLAALAGALDLLVWVILGMLAARAAIVYGLAPLVGRLPGGRAVPERYKVVMFWGGLRGAVALAIVMSLPPFAYREVFVALVMGSVLFTLLIQGLTIEPLVRRLGLAKPALPDRVALLERDLVANDRARQRLPSLFRGGLFSAQVADFLTLFCNEQIERSRAALEQLRHTEMDREQEKRLLFLRAMAEERARYDEMYAEGHLTEGAFRELTAVLTLQSDAMRDHGRLDGVHSHRLRRAVEARILRLLDRVIPVLSEYMRRKRIIRDYEEVWGHYQGSWRVIEYLEHVAGLESTPADVLTEVQEHYRAWHERARRQLDEVAADFPEFIRSMQGRLGRRLMLLSKAEVTRQEEGRGLLPHGLAEHELAVINHQINALRGERVQKLETAPEKLLRRVPLFAGLPAGDFAEVIARLRPRTMARGEEVIHEGERGDSLYLLGRGVVRVIQGEGSEAVERGTLVAGDFFGEMAVLNDAPRNASIRTVTPCLLYQLRRSDLEEMMARLPGLASTIRETAAEREQRNAPRAAVQ